LNKDIKLNNVKGLLIFLVVFGHLLSPFRKNSIELYLFIYSFHMPLFILLSGYFAKRASFKKVINLVLLYLIFQPLCREYSVLLHPGKIFKFKYEVPYFQLWYLVSMIAWYLIAIGINYLKLNKYQKVALVMGCFAIGIASKYFTEPVVDMMKYYDSKFYSYTFSYQRTLSFLPFFILGLVLTEDTMIKLYQSLKAKWIVVVAAIAGIFTYYHVTSTTNQIKILKGSYGVYEMKGALPHTTTVILIGYVIAIVMCYVILNVSGSKNNILTKWGERSLPIFLFHSFFVMYLKRLSFFNGLNFAVLLGLLIVISVIINVILSSDLFVKCTYYLCNPVEMVKLFPRRYKTA